MIEYRDVSYSYTKEDVALDGVSAAVKRGEFVAVIGHNGSGKSTLAKLTNALYLPTKGAVLVDGMDTSDSANTLAIRQRAGMVFQNPDNQMVTTIVEEDVAFGPENLGIAPAEIRRRVDASLAAVHMGKYAGSAPNMLSGGQKQRIAIAGVLAMEPQLIILDEPTAMLDPAGRRDVMNTVKRLNRENGITVLLITHFMDEAAEADRIIVMNDGKVAMSGTPKEVFKREEELSALNLDIPLCARLSLELSQAGVPVKSAITDEEMADELCRLYLKN